MTKVKLNPILFTLGLIVLFFPLYKIQAQTPGFTFRHDEQKIEISNEKLQEWKTKQIVSPNKLFVRQPEKVKDSFFLLSGVRNLSQNTNLNYNFSLAKIYDEVAEISKLINKPLKEPVLEINNNVATNFKPEANGLAVDIYKTTLETLNALETQKTEVLLTVNETFPKKTLKQTNDLGINELVATGVSKFNGSPKNRRHNITVGTEKFKGLIIQKGEEFSFNKYLGPVEAENGFLPELVIKRTGTVPELGGGLCQVSSTTFRAAMEAGLPITERRNHAYAVQYYSPQGTDATIYPGIVDFKFINDTPGAILIWPYLKDKDTLVFEIYGTKDNRQVSLETPVQYDKKTDGSMKAYWNRTVVKDGVEKKDNFKSIYQSPALFHKTEEFVSTPVDPIKGLQMPKAN
jgi:vancomycin resistance protein YoaR